MNMRNNNDNDNDNDYDNNKMTIILKTVTTIVMSLFKHGKV